MPPSKPLGEMTWTNNEGKTTKLGEMKGKVVILDFWATNCPPCLEEIPHLIELQTKYGAETSANFRSSRRRRGRRAESSGIRREIKDKLRARLARTALTGFIFAENTAIPQTVVFDREGKLVQKFIGFNEDIKNGNG